MEDLDPLRPHRFDAPLPLDREAARRWLGGKGASVAEMTRMGLRVPPGFTLGTGLFRAFEAAGGELPEGLEAVLVAELAELARVTGRRFGDAEAPLLLAVRSGGPTSMPGMLDTVLDVGVNAAIAAGLARSLEASTSFAYDVERRFLESFTASGFDVPRSAFDALAPPSEQGPLDEAGHAARLERVRECVAREVGAPITADPMEQLLGAIRNVLRSWRSPKAERYRAARDIADDEGTGVTIQAMVYGNLGAGSGAGVVTSRHPNTGEPGLFGEWLPDVQGDEIVSGHRTPQPLAASQIRRGRPDESLSTAHPEVAAQLVGFAQQLETARRAVCEVEFAFERGVVYALQHRPAALAARASARVHVDMVEEGRLDPAEALARFEPSNLRALITPRLPDPEELAARGVQLFVRGLASSPGAASGTLVLDEDALDALPEGTAAILARSETSAEDVSAMRRAAGVLTASGGLTSHAAVVARAIGKPCVTGATSLSVDYRRARIYTRGVDGEVAIEQGQTLTVDGSRGLVYAGELEVEPSAVTPHVETLLAWADERRAVEVWARARSVREARVGLSFGADGVVLSDEGALAWAALAAEIGADRLVVRLGTAVEAAAQIARSGLSPRVVVCDPEALEAVRGALSGQPLLPALGAAPPEGEWSALVPDASAEALARSRAAWLAMEEPSPAQLIALARAGGALVVSPLGVPLARMLAGRAAGAFAAESS